MLLYNYNYVKYFAPFFLLTPLNNLIFFSRKVFQLFKNGQKKCPKLKSQNILPQKNIRHCIIEIYRLMTEKIIFIL